LRSSIFPGKAVLQLALIYYFLIFLVYFFSIRKEMATLPIKYKFDGFAEKIFKSLIFRKHPERSCSYFESIVVFFRRLSLWVKTHRWETNTSLAGRLIKSIPQASQKELKKIQELYAQLMKGRVKTKTCTAFQEAYATRALFFENALLSNDPPKPLPSQPALLTTLKQEEVENLEKTLRANKEKIPSFLLESFSTTLKVLLNENVWAAEAHQYYTEILQGANLSEIGPEEIKLAGEILQAKIPLLELLLRPEIETAALLADLKALTWKVITWGKEEKPKETALSTRANKETLRKNLRAKIDQELEKPSENRSFKTLQVSLQIYLSFFKNPKFRKNLERLFKNTVTSREWKKLEPLFARRFNPSKLENPSYHANKENSPYGKMAETPPTQHAEKGNTDGIPSMIGSYWVTLINWETLINKPRIRQL
jgi:hypothetical protein